MDRQDINKNQLIERYIQDKLPDEERAALEEHFLHSDETLDELESAELLSLGLNDLAELETAHSEPASPSWTASAGQTPSGIMSLFHSPRYAMAASFLLVVSLGVSSALFHRLGGQEDTAWAINSAQIVPLVSVRSAASQTVNTVYVSDGQGQSVLMLDPGFEPFSHFRATISRLQGDEESEQVLQVDGLQPGYEEMLALALSGNVLESGDYEVVIEGWQDEWSPDHAFTEIDTVPFRVVSEGR